MDTKKWAALDIETRPIARLVEDPEYWDRRAEDMRAPGNYKDPEKIAAYKQDKLAQLKAEMALSPLTGEVCVIGLHDGDSMAPLILTAQTTRGTDTDERKVLQALCAHLDVDLHHMPIVGFNIQEFDLPFLWARCAVHGLLPDLPAPRDYRRVGELRSILTKGTLSDWMMSFGFDGKPGPAVEVANINELADRCRHDVTVTRQLGERLRGALSCLN